MNLTKLNPLQRAIGIVLIVVGAVWVLQGIGVATGSVMTGNTIWAVLGAACFVAGVLVLRRKPRLAAQDDAEPPDPAPADLEGSQADKQDLEGSQADKQDPEPPASA